MTTVMAYGSWPSPLAAEALVEGIVGLSSLQTHGRYLYWLEARPEEGGRSTLVRLDQAILYTTSPDIFPEDEKPLFRAVQERARLTRYGTDCYAYCLVAHGTVDLVVESGLNAYDIAALIPIIQAAGGVVTDWQGGDCRWGGQVVAAGSADLHAEVLELLAGSAR